MHDKELILAIDNGTQSLKALVFDLQGELQAKAQVMFEPYFAPKPGWAEQDSQVFWQALCSACQQLWHRHPELPERIAGVTLTAQRGTVIPVDKDGRPLRPAILWLDQRKSHGLPPLAGPWGIIFKAARLSKTIAYLMAEAEANWIRIHQPHIWERIDKYLLLSGYLTFRLTGEFADSIGCQVGYIPFDYRRLRWASDWNWKWQCLPLRPDMLPRLVPPAKPLGIISESAARQTGIPAGLTLVAAATDKACEVIGSGALESSVGCLSYGTSATINVTQKRYIESIPLLPAYPSAVPGRHTMEILVYRGYWMVNWFKREFGHPECRKAERTDTPPEALFEKLLTDTPPGSMGLMLQPYWSPGLKSPGPEAKGTIIGFGDVHHRGHFYRAILEGLAYALREGKEQIEKRSGTTITSLRVSGGGSQSDGALQLTADIFGLPTARPHLYETSGLGAAIDTAVGLKFYDDFESAVNAMSRTGDVFEPDPVHHRRYEALYRQVYLKIYKQVKPFYEKIREIVGYPD
mgnify:CR=1 FL=1